MGKGLSGHSKSFKNIGVKGIQVIRIAAPWPDVVDGINVESGVSHSSIVLDHGLFEIGSCLVELGLVYDGPAVDHPLGIAKQGGSGDGEEGFV